MANEPRRGGCCRVLLVCLLALLLVGQAPGEADDIRAAQLIKDLSGDAEGKPITRVNLNYTKVTDTQLRELG